MIIQSVSRRKHASLWRWSIRFVLIRYDHQFLCQYMIFFFRLGTIRQWLSPFFVKMVCKLVIFRKKTTTEIFDSAFFIQTPPPSFIIQRQKSIYLFALMMCSVFIYVLLFWLCTVYSTPLFANKCETYVIFMMKNDTYCFNCIEYHIGDEMLNHILMWWGE